MKMKKIVLLLLTTMPVITGWTQDTVESVNRANYFMTPFPDTLRTYVMSFIPNPGNACGIQTKEAYSKEGVKVYGVAAAMMTDRDAFYIPPEDPTVDSAEWWEDFFRNYRDTSIDECYEYLGIYFRSADSLVPQREVMVHRKYDTPAFYVKHNRVQWGNPNFVYPMYEKYFDSSIFVSDTFYVGVTLYTSAFRMTGYDNIGFHTLMYSSSTYSFHEYHVYKYCYPNETIYWEWPYRGRGSTYYLLFPILTSDPDNPEDPENPNVVEQADMLSRYISVHPNPAKDMARVLSSFGLTHVEAYDADGRSIYAREASGYETTLDVTAWPAGTYLLRITTPMGAVTKKLLVR